MKFNGSVLCLCLAALLTACGGGDAYDAGAQKVRLVAQALTFVGSGNAGGGSADGTGSTVQFANPTAVALASNGDLYIGDNNRIRKATPAGVVTTHATLGTNVQIFGLAVDADGNIFASSFYNEIYKVSSSTPAVVTVFAGNGSAGFQNLPIATFNSPRGLAIDQSGNVYVADRDNNVIRKIRPDGVVSTFAGSGAAGHADGPVSVASFNNPEGVAFDASGNLYVSDTNNELIRKISTSGYVTTVAGSGAVGSADGTGTAASFNTPQGLTIDNKGNIIVADAGNHSIRTVTPQGVVTTLAGYGSSGKQDAIGVRAKFFNPMDIKVGSDGTFYVADNGNYVIRLLKMIWI